MSAVAGLFQRASTRRRRRMCVLANGVARRSMLRSAFRVASRLGDDGVFWYALIALMPCGSAGLAGSPALQMAVTGRARPAAVQGAEGAGWCVGDPASGWSASNARCRRSTATTSVGQYVSNAVLFTVLATHHVPGLALLLPFAATVAASGWCSAALPDGRGRRCRARRRFARQHRAGGVNQACGRPPGAPAQVASRRSSTPRYIRLQLVDVGDPQRTRLTWMVALHTPSSTTWAPIGAMKRPSDVPPPVDIVASAPCRRSPSTAADTASDSGPGGV